MSSSSREAGGGFTDLQLSHPAPIKCLANMNFPSNLKFNGSKIQDFQEVKDTLYCHPTQEAVEPDGDSVKTSEETQRGPFYQHGLGICPSFYPGSGDMKLSNLKAVKGQFYSYSGDNQFRYAPVLRIPQNYLNEYNFQDFHYFVVIDFEATCDKEKVPNPQEIIEFPSVIVNGMTGQLEACFQTYVRPTCNRILSDFCKDLTGIQQIQVDRGVTLSEALLRHDKWLEKKGVKDKNFAVVTWSSWDCRVMLESECRYKKIRKPSYFNRWINLRVPFREIFGGARCNLKEAVEMTGLAWQGRAHCGLDDAKNTACLLAKLMSRGFRFSITDTMVSDHHHHHHPAFDDSFTSSKQPTEFAFTPHFPSLRLMAMHLPATTFQFEPHCYCGVKSSKGMVRKPGPKQGCMFYGCGNWTAAMGARCHFFHWVSP